MTSEKYTLLDIPSNINGRCLCWSLNTWKVRAVLNYKNLPYDTEWTEFPDIAPKVEKLCVSR